jgi:hypothetical protein
MPGLIREARDMQGIRKEATPNKESETGPTAPPAAGSSRAEAPPSRPGKKS